MSYGSAAECPIGVIGAGIMGAGIAQVFAQAGHPVRLRARKRETLDAALQGIRVNQDELIRHGLLGAAEAEADRTEAHGIRQQRELVGITTEPSACTSTQYTALWWLPRPMPRYPIRKETAEGWTSE